MPADGRHPNDAHNAIAKLNTCELQNAGYGDHRDQRPSDCENARKPRSATSGSFDTSRRCLTVPSPNARTACDIAVGMALERVAPPSIFNVTARDQPDNVAPWSSTIRRTVEHCGLVFAAGI